MRPRDRGAAGCPGLRGRALHRAGAHRWWRFRFGRRDVPSRRSGRTARVFGVEPEMAADAAESLRVGHIVRWDAERVGRTAADGMRTSSLGRLTFRHLAARLDGVLTVSEPAIRRAMVRAGREARLVLEPSGATTLAASLFEVEQLPRRWTGGGHPERWQRRWRPVRGAAFRGDRSGGMTSGGMPHIIRTAWTTRRTHPVCWRPSGSWPGVATW